MPGATRAIQKMANATHIAWELEGTIHTNCKMMLATHIKRNRGTVYTIWNFQDVSSRTTSADCCIRGDGSIIPDHQTKRVLIPPPRWRPIRMALLSWDSLGSSRRICWQCPCCTSPPPRWRPIVKALFPLDSRARPV